MKLFVVDTETSGLDPNKGATILELAWIELNLKDKWVPTNYYRSYIEYDGYIDPHAQAANHIRTDSLTRTMGAVPRAEAIGWMLRSLETDSILIAHNSAFDSQFLPELRMPWLCTYKTARHIWPEAPGYSNQVLRYWLGVNPCAKEIIDLAPIVAHQQPHQALFDVATTTGILLKMLEKYTPEQLLQLHKTPVLLKKIGFGKYADMDFDKIPKDYLQWLRRQSNLDDNVRYTIDQTLK